MVVEDDILLDRKGVQYVSYLSSGMDYGVPAAVEAQGKPKEHNRQTENKDFSLFT